MAVDNLGFQTVWRISINERPSPEWIQCFSQQQEGSALCSPVLVSFHQTGILFTSDSAGLSTWVKFIEKWTRAANAAVATAYELRRQEAQTQLAMWKEIVGEPAAPES